ncbi:hypothetical protein [Aliiglaciecola lipolytica]|uniref:Uncharacterized protein n=1 Tax=Aliiglaciecola lipolytica E3 TaxID=1127673 RepID=K6X2N9_9ALTE|nr:hypothetical protein [Aliiglaciecola lipolytica]GAC14899.1 hypothetical protein GLIP_2271 [Aliiglaciecola lipolytica E3]
MLLIKQSKLVIAVLTVLCISAKTHANNTSGVTGPIVKPNDQSYQFRTAYTPSDNGEREQLVVRMNVQKSVSDDVRLRVVGQVRDTTGSFEFDSISADLLWQFQHKEDGIWDSAVRFDLKARKAHRSEGFSFKWTNRWSFAPEWSLTQVLSFSRDIGGDNPASGTYLESRTGLAYKSSKNLTFSLDSFNQLGKIGDFGSANQESHQIGPSMSGKIEGFSYSVSYLAGVSSAAKDNVFRLFIGKSF